MYLAERKSELAQTSLYSHRSRLNHFVKWCADEDISNLNDLTVVLELAFEEALVGDGIDPGGFVGVVAHERLQRDWSWSANPAVDKSYAVDTTQPFRALESSSSPLSPLFIGSGWVRA